jgi:tetratricopeptide (TPR) repeat protein
MYHDWDWRGAEVSYARALELAPGNTRMLSRAGTLAFCLGRLEEAIGLYRRALEQDPLSSGSYKAFGGVLNIAGRFAEAEEAHRRELELDPHSIFAHALLSETLIAQGRGEEALAEAMREPEEWARLYALAIVHHAMDQGAQADAALRELIEKYPKSLHFQIAEVHADRGETDAAFEWLERGYAQRDSGLVGVKISPRLRSLHGDPRWNAFMKKMGFEVTPLPSTREA